MKKKSTRSTSLLLAVLLLALWSAGCTQNINNNIPEQKTTQIAPSESSVISSLPSVQQLALYNSSPAIETGNYVENDTNNKSPLQLYVTPGDPAVVALAAQTNGVQDAYKIAIKWIYVSEQKLYQVTDKWLTPHEFLTDTPRYTGNPVEGEQVGDCEEQAHTLVSLIRAGGIPPEEVRMVLGEVEFGNGGMGHAWVELLINDRWVALEPDSGPYWDDEAGELVIRRGIPFYYYDRHDYPVVKVWTYYNDIYYWDVQENSGNAPDWWIEATP